MVWQEGDKIQFSRLNRDNSGFFFDPVITIDEGDCRNPDIQNSDASYTEQYIAWEKGSQGNPDIWYSFWSVDNGGWSEPLLLFDDGLHSNIRFSKSIDLSMWVSILLSDQLDSTGQYHISGYDFYDQNEFISEFAQPVPFQPDLFSIDLITDFYWETSFLTFKYDEESNNSDIFSSDYGYMQQEFDNYCRIDSSAQPDQYPQLFQGAWHYSYFDLLCIWESWRNGHWQLFSSVNHVYIGAVPEVVKEADIKIYAYPNPSSSLTTFTISLQNSANVNLTVFNNLGQVVATILDDPLEKGEHQAIWNSEGLAPGIYFYRILSDDDSSTGKMVIVK